MALGSSVSCSVPEVVWLTYMVIIMQSSLLWFGRPALPFHESTRGHWLVALSSCQAHLEHTFEARLKIECKCVPLAPVMRMRQKD